MKTKILIIIGMALMFEGFSSFFYSSYVMFPPTEPPLMKPLEGIDYVLLTYKQSLLVSGIIGSFVFLIGIVLVWRKKQGNKGI